MACPAEITDRSDPRQRAWVAAAVQAIEADANRSADTHLIRLPLPALAYGQAGEAASQAAGLYAALRRLDALSPAFLRTPGLALNNCYQALIEMYALAREGIFRAIDIVEEYDQANYDRIQANETIIDHMADRLSNYLMQVSAHLTSERDVEIMNHYYSAVTEFERLGDHAVNIAEWVEFAMTGMHKGEKLQ